MYSTVRQLVVVRNTYNKNTRHQITYLTEQYEFIMSRTCTCVFWMEGWKGKNHLSLLYRVCPRPSFIVAICLVPTYKKSTFNYSFTFIALSLLCNGFGHFLSTCGVLFNFSLGRIILLWTESVFVIFLFCCLTASAVSDSQCRIWLPMPIVWLPVPCLTASAVSDSQCRLSDRQCLVWQPKPIVLQPMPKLSDSQCRRLSWVYPTILRHSGI